MKCLLPIFTLAVIAGLADSYDDSPRWDVVSTLTSDICRGSTDSGLDKANFYYPIVIEECESNDDAVPNFPLITFLQGANADMSLYSKFATQWTANDVLEDIIERVNDPGSPLFQIVDTENVGISGHSNGETAAIFVPSTLCQPPFCFGPPGSLYGRPEVYKAAAVFGTHTVPMFGPPVPLNVDNNTPLAIVQGNLDAMDNVCAKLPFVEPEKELVVLGGVSHWGITNIQNPETNTHDPSAQTKSQQWSNMKCVKWASVVFDAYLMENRGAMKKLVDNRAEQG